MLLVRLYRWLRQSEEIEYLRRYNKQLLENECQYIASIKRLVFEKNERVAKPDLKDFDPLYRSGDLVNIIDVGSALRGCRGRVLNVICTIDQGRKHITYEVQVFAPDKDSGTGPTIKFNASQLVLARRDWNPRQHRAPVIHEAGGMVRMTIGGEEVPVSPRPPEGQPPTRPQWIS